MNGTFEKMAEIINGREQRSAWRRGVTAYARFAALQKERPGIETIQDTERRPWEH